MPKTLASLGLGRRPHPGRPRAVRPGRRRRGVLTFEWIVLLTLVVIGIVGGLSAVRDATTSELGDVAAGIESIDQSFTGFGTQFVDTPSTAHTVRPPAGGP